MDRGRWWLVWGACLSVMVVACGSASSAKGPSATAPMTTGPAARINPWAGSGPRVAVVGDSVDFLASVSIAAALGQGGFSHSVTSIPSKTSRDMAPYVASAVAAKPRVIVLELGTNDAAAETEHKPGYALADYQKRMVAFRRQFPDACFVVTTVTSHREPGLVSHSAFNSYATALDSWLKATFPNVIDWDTYEWGQRQAGTRLVDASSVHPNDAGQKALGDLVAGAARKCLAR